MTRVSSYKTTVKAACVGLDRLTWAGSENKVIIIIFMITLQWEQKGGGSLQKKGMVEVLYMQNEGKKYKDNDDGSL